MVFAELFFKWKIYKKRDVRNVENIIIGINSDAKLGADLGTN